ncbi:ribokinase [Mesorhizobium xinjiangense]|uniref:ribokinase n=1 Tax=Mesorhizobium xinjiangense TaxID=2678685 RepID=UPI0012EDD74E|nr:ribokinase [Mesorhizobium xinjiangense]
MITVIGSINLDLIASVDRLPGAGETVPGTSFETAPGGKGANQALAAVRAGAKVRMVGAVGRDPFADQALALLKQDGVEVSAVRAVDVPTGTALILVGPGGENMIAVVPGANAAVSPASLDDQQLGAGDHLLLQHEVPLETVAAALEAAREAHAVSLLNTAPFREEAAPFLERADYVIANETEFDLYAQVLALDGQNRQERVRAFASATGRAIVVTLGAEGVMAATPSRFHEIPAMKITAIDTVGAGDTFCGYLGAALAEGMGLEAALQRAATAGALACLKPGAQPSIPRRREVDAVFA